MFYDGGRRDIISLLTRTFSRSDAASYNGRTLLKCITLTMARATLTRSRLMGGRLLGSCSGVAGYRLLNRLLTWAQGRGTLPAGTAAGTHPYGACAGTATGWLWLAAGGAGLRRCLVAFQNRLSKRQWRWFLRLASCWCSHQSRDGRTCDRSTWFHGSTWCADGKDGYEEPISLSSGNRERFLAMFKPDFPPSYRAAIFTITALGDGRALSIYIGVAWREVDIDRSPTWIRWCLFPVQTSYSETLWTPQWGHTGLKIQI